jgi:extradiol dioxygenase family protein
MRRFYREVLGAMEERVVADIGLHQLRVGRALIDLVPVGSPLGGDEPPSRRHFNLAHYCVLIEPPDWAAVRAHLERHGVASDPPSRRYGADGYGLSLYLDDPEGNTIELKAAARG